MLLPPPLLLLLLLLPLPLLLPPLLRLRVNGWATAGLPSLDSQNSMRSENCSSDVHAFEFTTPNYKVTTRPCKGWLLSHFAVRATTVGGACRAHDVCLPCA